MYIYIIRIILFLGNATVNFLLTVISMLKNSFIIFTLWTISVLLTLSLVITLTLFISKKKERNTLKSLGKYTIISRIVLALFTYFLLFSDWLTNYNKLPTEFKITNQVIEQLIILRVSLAMYLPWLIAIAMTSYTSIEFILSENKSILFMFSKKLKSRFSKDLPYYTMIYFIQLLFLYCLASFLSWFIVGVRIPEKVEVSIIFFIIICLYLQSVILFTVCVKLILKSIDLIFENFFKKNNYRNRKSSHISYFISNIKQKKLKKEKKLYIESIISIIGIATLPTISFFIIYGTTNSITHLPDEFPGRSEEHT